MSARPLEGKRIVVTRALARAGPLVEQLAAAGATVISMPAARIERMPSAALERALTRVNDYDWVLFTSRTAVEVLFDVLHAMASGAERLADVKIAAIGPATAEALTERGVSVDVMPSRFVAEGLLDQMRERTDVRGARVLYPTAEGAREVLPRGLAELGAAVERIAIYRSVPDGEGAGEARRMLERGGIDLVTFTSPSTVQGFVDAVGADAARRASAATIGPVTSQAARDAGIDVAIEAGESTIEGLVTAVIEFVSAGSRRD